MKLYTAGFLFSKDGRDVLLIQKERPDWQRGKWNGIGGHIEAGETALECMRREFREETGLDIEHWNLYAVLKDSQSESFRVSFFYAMDDRIFQAKTMTDETVADWPTNELPDTIPNLRWLIPMALSMNEDAADRFFIDEVYP